MDFSAERNRATDLLPVWRLPPENCVLAPADLHLWLVHLLASDDEVERAELLLSADEIDRAHRFHFARDARRYVVAHAALRTILSRYLDLLPRQLEFVTNPYGKPSLSLPHPHPAPALTFNLSHSGELALVGIAAGRRIGADIEQIRPEVASRELATRFFSPAEVRALTSLPPTERTRAFFRCWTRKEAYVKARGEGLSVPLDSFDVTLLPSKPAAILRTGHTPDEAHRWSLHSVPIDASGSYEAAVVVEGQVARNHAWQHTPS